MHAIFLCYQYISLVVSHIEGRNYVINSQLYEEVSKVRNCLGNRNYNQVKGNNNWVNCIQFGILADDANIPCSIVAAFHCNT